MLEEDKVCRKIHQMQTYLRCLTFGDPPNATFLDHYPVSEEGSRSYRWRQRQGNRIPSKAILKFLKARKELDTITYCSNPKQVLIKVVLKVRPSTAVPSEIDYISITTWVFLDVTHFAFTEYLGTPIPRIGYIVHENRIL